MGQKERARIARFWLIIMFIIILMIGVLSAYLRYIGKNSPLLILGLLFLSFSVLYIVVKIIIPKAIKDK